MTNMTLKNLRHRLLYLKVKNQVGAFMLRKAGKPLFAASMFLHKHKMNMLAIGLLDLHIQLFTNPGCKIIDDVKMELDEIEKIMARKEDHGQSGKETQT